jgi:cytochrome c biogenesis protein CcmG/thiol:disulfide interchange protein DsbE
MFFRIFAAAILLLAPLGASDEQPRKPAPGFTLLDAQGAEVRLSDYKGKVVLLNFWATWCTGCKEEIPSFIDFQTKYKSSGLEVLGVSMDDDGWKVLKPYLAEHPMNYKVMLGNDAVGDLYGGVDALPTTLLIDREGKIAATHTGVVDRAVCEKELRGLLGEK